LADSAFFVKAGLVKSNKTPVKVLGTGELKKAVTVKAAAFSKLAREKIEKSGGKAEKC
jgi:large subunit ribosomal protein L15